jgi:hypothetical protein
MSWASEDIVKLLLTVIGSYKPVGVVWNDVAQKLGTGRSGGACQYVCPHTLFVTLSYLLVPSSYFSSFSSASVALPLIPTPKPSSKYHANSASL